jgi:tetratricopeptide (TPR) repeat protein
MGGDMVAGARRVSGTILATILLAVSLLSPPPIGAAIGDREQALAALAMRDDVEARRRGTEALGEFGVMADVPTLAAALRDPDDEVRALAERSLWRVWSRSGDPAIDRRFLQGVEQMQRQELDDAIETFTDIITRKPEFAEGWNKRATAYYLAGELDRSLADCDEVMKRNPAHFGALSGYGMIHLQLGRPDRALGYFERALAVNPNLAGIEEAVQAIKRFLEQQQKGTT